MMLTPMEQASNSAEIRRLLSGIIVESGLRTAWDLVEELVAAVGRENMMLAIETVAAEQGQEMIEVVCQH
jgi:hypothetical protein